MEKVSKSDLAPRNSRNHVKQTLVMVAGTGHTLGLRTKKLSERIGQMATFSTAPSVTNQSLSNMLSRTRIL